MALDSQNWKRKYLKSRAKVKALKSELTKLRESSNADELSEIKNEIALLREDINLLTELVKEFFSADHESDELPPEDEPDNYNTINNESEIETGMDVATDDDNIQDDSDNTKSECFEVTITIENGIDDVIPSMIFAQTASMFKSKVWIEVKGIRIDAKSFLLIMASSLKKGTEITITAEGPDAREAVSTLRNLVDSKFGED